MPPLPPDVVLRPDIETRPVVRVAANARAAATATAALLGVIWGSPLMAKMVGDGDFPFHVQAAREFAANGVVTMPHFLLQVLLGGVLATGLFASGAQAAVLFFCALYAAAAAAICWYLARGSTGTGALVGSVILAIALLMSAPILPRSEPSLYLIGYFPANAYHNPTMLLAKPLLVAALAAAVTAMTRTGTLGRSEMILLGTSPVLLGLAKPNYLGCLVPVLLVGGACAQATKRLVSWRRIGLVCGAAFITLATGYILYRSDGLGFQSSVIFAPFAVVALYAPVDPATIARNLLASLAFPLVVTALWPRAATRDIGMSLAWGATVVGLFFSYFLGEGQGRLDHGNFLWTGQMAVFVLFVAAAAFVRARLQVTSPSTVMFGRTMMLGVVLAFHVESGLRHAAVKIQPSDWLAYWM